MTSKKPLQDQKDKLIQSTTSKEEKINNPKSLKELARDKIKLNNRQLNKQTAKKMFNPYYFKDNDFYNYFKNKFGFTSHQPFKLKNHNIIYNRI